ncbi:MAG: imidazole glycerol phosphate synthase cyclase subunit [Pseudomonadota bacterium]|nr:imidazole glycerol phosphate synthase cyclase subunit [Pseudomonadota bacterium]|tara:strand:- start:370 stop:1146 length:777 start_codon:yes stop_codon:yes gene_type:complete
MLKKRIIPKFLLNNGSLVKYKSFFNDKRMAGNPVSTAKIYNDYGADEFIILDIVPSDESKSKVLEIIKTISEEVFMPLTVGGGIKSLEDINLLLRAGADKIVINSQAVINPNFVNEAAKTFGDQCITISIDYAQIKDGVHRVFINGGRDRTKHNPIDWALKMQDSFCGEVLLTSIERDGNMNGYDLKMIKELDSKLDIPLVISGGCGGIQHCVDALNAGASALAISSLFLFTDHSPIKLRSHLYSNGVNVRASKNSRN